jgi:2-polyprenyl-3-methyl-5-hydroxy-6-metoxy-1,4-benzoquinol methylase
MLAQRSYEPELLDEQDIPEQAFGPMLREINYININLGGHKVTLDGLKGFHLQSLGRPVVIAEIGCGGGDNLKIIHEWSKRLGIKVELIGIDIRPECIAFAKRHTAGIPVEYIVSDYKLAEFQRQPDIIFNALFCHHFPEKDLLFMLRWMKQNSRLGFFINDLHRHFLAWSSIKLLTGLFSRSYMVKYDAPLSVKRGFKKEEWQALLKEAGIEQASVQWKWAFRHLIVWKSLSQ